MDLMSSLMAMCRYAIEFNGERTIETHFRPDHSKIGADTQRVICGILANETLESLVDLVEWQYEERRKAQVFWTVNVTTEIERQPSLWSAVSLLQLTWVDANDEAVVGANSVKNETLNALTPVVATFYK